MFMVGLSKAPIISNISNHFHIGPVQALINIFVNYNKYNALSLFSLTDIH